MSKKYVPIKEFRDFGFIQEINRTFLHPMGMALEVIREDDGSMRLGGVWDSREDPEGYLFADSVVDGDEYNKKIKRVNNYWIEKGQKRVEKLGFMIQPTKGK